jgi:uncharacterized Zn finger protein
MASRDRPIKTSTPFAAFLERGEDYFFNGQVKTLAEHEEKITAKVLGTLPYRVDLWIEGGILVYLPAGYGG